MSRPLRIELAGASYHLTARGNRREMIFHDEGEHVLFLEVLIEVYERFNWQLHADCLMTNQYHVLVETPDANLFGERARSTASSSSVPTIGTSASAISFKSVSKRFWCRKSPTCWSWRVTSCLAVCEQGWCVRADLGAIVLRRND